MNEQGVRKTGGQKGREGDRDRGREVCRKLLFVFGNEGGTRRKGQVWDAAAWNEGTFGRRICCFKAAVAPQVMFPSKGACDFPGTQSDATGLGTARRVAHVAAVTWVCLVVLSQTQVRAYCY